MDNKAECESYRVGDDLSDHHPSSLGPLLFVEFGELLCHFLSLLKWNTSVQHHSDNLMLGNPVEGERDSVLKPNTIPL